MRVRAVFAWLTLSAYFLAVLGAYALHPPHVGDCTFAHGRHPDHDAGGHAGHANHAAGHDHDGEEHPPSSPLPEGDDCVWCQFLALAAWQGPAVAELPLAVPAGTLSAPAPRQCLLESITLHPARGPPCISPAEVV